MDKPVLTGQKYNIKLENFAEGGDTVGHIGGVAVFVPFGIPGETVEIEATEVKKNYARGSITQVLDASPSRLEPPCRYFYSCGGCQFQHMSYPEQLLAKQRIVRDALERIGGLSGVTVHETKPSPLTLGYRNKVQQPVAFKGGQPVTGFYASGSHDLVPIEECLVEPSISNQIIRHIMSLLPKLRVTPYDEGKHQGTLRHIIVRTGFKTQEVMVILVVNIREFVQARQLAREIMYKFPQVISVIQNTNTDKTNVILGKDTRVIEGRGFLYEMVENLKFKISPESFFQVNTDQGWQIVRIVMAQADLKGLETVADIYSGIGMMGLFIARKAQKVLGVESLAQAVGDAQTNAQINKIRNVKFVCTDALTGLVQMKKEAVNPQVVVLDPPRQGCEPAVLEALVALAPPRIIYVSCDPATLARDLGFLAKRGYETQEVQPVDMFPQTSHVESVAKVVQKQLELI